MKRRSLVQAAGATALLPLATLAQDKYPSKAITWVCPYAAGGNADSRSRQVAKVMSNLLGQPILIDNKAGAGGNIGLVRPGDTIRIDIPARSIDVLISDAELEARRAEQDKLGWKPVEDRPRKVTASLRAYAKLATSADKGAVRDLSQL